MNTQRLNTMRVSHGYHLLPIRPGMQLELHEKVGEGNNQRIWKFKGLVLKVKKPKHADGTFTIRGKVAGHTIEKIYPLSFVNFEKVMLLDEYKIRRAKLYYIRDKVGKDAKMTSILTQHEKNIDLLELAKEEVEALKKAYDESQEEETPVVEESSETEEQAPVESTEEVTENAPEETTDEKVEESETTEEEKKEE